MCMHGHVCKVNSSQEEKHNLRGRLGVSNQGWPYSGPIRAIVQWFPRVGRKPVVGCSRHNPLRYLQMQIPGPTPREPGAKGQLLREVLIAARFGKHCPEVTPYPSEALKVFLPSDNFNF